MKTLYQAKDGELFEDKDACLEHEQAISRPLICVDGNISKIIRKRIVDETGIHYPVSEIVVAEIDGFGSNQATHFFHVPINPYVAHKYNGCFKKGSYIHVSGQVVAKTKRMNNTLVVDLVIVNTSIAMRKPSKRTKKGT